MSDSDDDIPISELIKKRKLQQAAALKAAEPKAKPEAKKVKTEKAEKPAKSEKSSESKSNPSRQANYNKAAEFYNETQKGFLVQKLMVRWWYAMEWPVLEEIGTPPPGYESLDGFKGVFISTKV